MDKATLKKELEKMSREIVPSEQILKAGNDAADQVFRVLQANGRYALDRFKVGGSIGKATAINPPPPDFDLVVFVNNELPYFKNVLNYFEYKLKNSDLGVKNTKVTKFSLQFEVNNISFDLLPATNFVKEFPKPGGAELARKQCAATMAHIRGHPGFGYRFGSAVCEENLEFLKRQSGFVHDVIRLAKFWNKTLEIDTYISGRSAMIELVAIQAANLLEASGNRSILDGFMSFLSLMSRFDVLKINLNQKEDQIPKDVLLQRPLVLDPTNPYNNFAWFGEKKRAEIIKKFMLFANETLKRLNTSKDLDSLFKPQGKL